MEEKRVRSFKGVIEYRDRRIIKGWALDEVSPDSPVVIQVFQGNRPLWKITPHLFRWDLLSAGKGNGFHGFVLPLEKLDIRIGGGSLRFVFPESGEELANSPVVLEEFPEMHRIPFRTTDLTGGKVLVLAPHPDDESLSCGGAILLHRQAGNAVKVVFLTNGARSASSESENGESMAERRREEASRAAAILGVTDLEFWDYPDRELPSGGRPAARLARLLEEYRPSLLYVPSPLEFHPDHRAAAQVAWHALRETNLLARVAFYELNRPVSINTLVDITAVVELKRKACDQYGSQQTVHPYTDCAIGLNRYRSLSVSRSCSYAEGFFLINSTELREIHPDALARRQLAGEVDKSERELPLVTIIVRTRNRPGLLRQALASIAAQTYPSVEVVVVNDGGEDPVPAAKEFDGLLTIRFASTEKSSGRSAAANAGLSMAQGKYVNFLDDDDLFHPHHIGKLAGFLEETGELAAYSDCERRSYTWSDNEFVPAGEPELFKGYEYDRDRLHYQNYIPIMTMMFARSLAEKVGPVDENLEVFEDWDLWLRMSGETSFHRLPGVSALYRDFAGHGYDFRRWTLAIYDKYGDYWSPEKLASFTWPRIEALAADSGNVRQELAEARQGLDIKGEEVDKLVAEIENARMELETERLEHISLKGQINELRLEKERNKRRFEELQRDTDQLKQHCVRSEAEAAAAVVDLKRQLEAKELEAARLTGVLQSIEDSLTWKAATSLRKVLPSPLKAALREKKEKKEKKESAEESDL